VSAILNLHPLGMPWPTLDPFLFCVHHVDHYPCGDGQFGPAASLAGHQLGQDFFNADGWRMYHGTAVPGFPAHPHRGFETVTIVRRGLVDHSDSLGAAARYGAGDVQWLTAGSGIVHAEMFPLLDTRESNPLELFQIWLNLPAQDKLTAPQFRMFWSKQIPRHTHTDAAGAPTTVTCIAGRIGAEQAPPPPAASWAAQEENDVAIWLVSMTPGARWTLPPARSRETSRSLYLFGGGQLRIGDQLLTAGHAAQLDADQAVPLHNGGAAAEFLLLQGRPIGQPVAASGPFVMNSERELQQAYADFQRSRFGGWNWPSSAPVRSADPARFARYIDGRLERPD